LNARRIIVPVLARRPCSLIPVFAVYDQSGSQRYSQHGSYYNGARDSLAEQDMAVPMSPPTRNRFQQRQYTEPGYDRRYNNGRVYPAPGFHNSRDTVNTGASSGSQSEPWANTTDPSSENSSIDRVNAVPKQDPDGFNPHFQTVDEESGVPSSGYSQPNGAGWNRRHGPSQSYGGAPPVPQHESSRPASRLIKLSDGGNQSGAALDTDYTPQRPQDSGKKKGWLKRTFSKKG